MNEKIFIEALEWADVQPSIRFLEYLPLKLIYWIIFKFDSYFKKKNIIQTNPISLLL